mgnify:CR=1 FL=1|tara:strand:+ start:133 stop:249 length:117 start_codon:yes stop_codon:yes gene_type:complete
MEKVISEAKRIWGLAMANKKVAAGVIIAIVILYHLITN